MTNNLFDLSHRLRNPIFNQTQMLKQRYKIGSLVEKQGRLLPHLRHYASPASLGVEMITHFDAETALRCCQMK